MTTVREWTEAIFNENDPHCDLFQLVTAKWPHVTITDTEHTDTTRYHGGGPVGYALDLMREVMRQTGCDENNIITVSTAPYNGTFAIAFTEDMYAVHFKLLAEPAPYMRVEYHGR